MRTVYIGKRYVTSNKLMLPNEPRVSVCQVLDYIALAAVVCVMLYAAAL